MNRPGLLVRLAGTPLVSFLLFFGYGILVIGWLQDRFAWWLAVIAVVAALRTLAAVGELKRYKAWAAEWNAMGASNKPNPRPEKRQGARWIRITGAALLVLAIPYLPRETNHHQALSTMLIMLWLVACLYLIFVAMRGMVRFMKKRSKTAGVKAAAGNLGDTAVAWLVGRAAFSPSRAEAQSNLPDYCARLIEPASQNLLLSQRL